MSLFHSWKHFCVDRLHKTPGMCGMSLFFYWKDTMSGRTDVRGISRPLTVISEHSYLANGDAPGRPTTTARPNGPASARSIAG